jgi:hypothetical protein
MKLIVLRKRFIATHSDECGQYGHYIDEFAVTEEDGRFICWVSDLEDFLKSPIAGLLDTKPIEKILTKCKSVS